MLFGFFDRFLILFDSYFKLTVEFWSYVNLCMSFAYKNSISCERRKLLLIGNVNKMNLGSKNSSKNLILILFTNFWARYQIRQSKSAETIRSSLSLCSFRKYFLLSQLLSTTLCCQCGKQDSAGYIQVFLQRRKLNLSKGKSCETVTVN